MFFPYFFGWEVMCLDWAVPFGPGYPLQVLARLPPGCGLSAAIPNGLREEINMT